MAPTKVGQFGYRRFDRQGQGSRSAGAQLAPTTVWLRGPWAGFEPDLAPNQASPGAAKDCTGLIDRDGILSQQNGFERVGSAYLPLGDTTPPASSADAEPVVCITEGRTASSQALRRYVITSDTAAAGYGHFYELVAGVWTYRAFGGAGTAFVGDASDRAATLCDAAHFTAGDYTVFASGQANSLYRFPGAAVPAEYETLTGLGGLTTLRANSIVSSEERIHAFGTMEAGTYYPSRWRWTSKGTNGQFDPTLTGAGFADVTELGGEGLAIRNIGTKLALYTTTGVMLARRTGQTTDPFAKDYTSYERGLLSTHSAVNIGSGLHFGLFTDGWFVLRYDGMWEERGLTDKGYSKWRREFYGTLDWTNRKRIVCTYDENAKWVYIAFPQAGAEGNAPSTVWVYDIVHDACWPATGWARKPNIFGAIVEEASVGATWGSFGTTPWASGSGSWGSFETATGQHRVLHGTSDGLVFVHHPALVTQDGILPTYTYRSHYFAGQQPETYRSVMALQLNYTRILGDDATEPTPIGVSYSNETGRLKVGSISQTKGTPGTEQVDFASPGVVSGLSHTFTISGTTPLKVSAIGLELSGEASTTRKEDAV